MRIVRDKEHSKLFVVSDLNDILLEFGFFADEFVCDFFAKHITIPKEIDSNFFETFQNLFKQHYQFSHTYSYQDQHKIVWLSDQYGNLENSEEVSRISRMILEIGEDDLTFSFQTPFLDQEGYPYSQGMVALSPAGNGSWSKNQDTGKSFQTEFIESFWSILQGKTKQMRKKKSYE